MNSGLLIKLKDQYEIKKYSIFSKKATSAICAVSIKLHLTKTLH